MNPKVYYKLDNFFANHRNFVKSRNFKQLRGAATYPADEAQIITSCSPLVYNQDMDDTATSIVNNSLDPSNIAQPCGIIANYNFNDTFKIINSHKQYRVSTRMCSTLLICSRSTLQRAKSPSSLRTNGTPQGQRTQYRSKLVPHLSRRVLHSLRPPLPRALYR